MNNMNMFGTEANPDRPTVQTLGSQQRTLPTLARGKTPEVPVSITDGHKSNDRIHAIIPVSYSTKALPNVQI